MKKIAILAAALAPVSIGCSRPGNASPDQCQKACVRVANFRLAPQRSLRTSKVHELDEEVDSTEEEAAKQRALIRQELAEGGPAWNPKAFEKLPAKTRREMAERHQWDVKQLKVQRELALKRIDDEIAAAKKRYEDARAEAAVEEKNSTDEAVKACAGPCVQRPPKFAECLLRTQALEDVEICERK